jgi:galactokinase/mevalonate kinase-like predicted kinase
MSDWSFLIPLFGVSIPIVAITAGVVTKWIAMKEKQLEITARTAGEQAAQYAAKIERLEAHVAVLNRIVTDRNEGLTAQIESLRDTPTDKFN